MRFPVALFAVCFALAGCQFIYKLPTRQGNVLEQKQLDQLNAGMTKEQVKFLLGTPITASPYREDRWDYLAYYKTPHGKVASRTVTLYFDSASILTRMEGIKVAAAQSQAMETPDVKTVSDQEKKDRTEKSREESEEGKNSGVVITPKQP